jgi:hypothetical protein
MLGQRTLLQALTELEIRESAKRTTQSSATGTKQEVGHAARCSGAAKGGMMSQVWLITESSRGLGKAFAEAAL